MKKMARVEIKSVAQTDNAGLFTICFEGESFTEFQNVTIEERRIEGEDLKFDI